MKNEIESNHLVTRRQALVTAATAAAGIAAARSAQAAEPAGFTLPALPYAHDALEPHFDALTMQIHHGKHHQAYITNLNKALAGHADLLATPIEALLKGIDRLPESVRTAVRNQGGGHHNHSLFWTALKKQSGVRIPDKLDAALTRDLGGMETFKQKLTEAATKVFGSGWAWLSLTADRKLVVESTPNQDSPLSKGHVPLLGIDVWEHAYYLKYQNRRPEYIAAFFNLIHWEEIAARYEKASG